MVRAFKLSALMLALALSPWRLAQAEVTLTDWKTYAAMAEQGAVCGAFAHIMEMQSMVDQDLGQLWAERRNYSGSIVIRAAQLEGRTDIDGDAVDELLNRYSMWLLNNLASAEDSEVLGSNAREAARDMIADVCTGLFAQADEAILSKYPGLGQCQASPKPSGNTANQSVQPTQTPSEPASCIADTSGITTAAVKQAEQEAANMLMQLQREQQARTDLSSAKAQLEQELASVRSELNTLRSGNTQGGEEIGVAEARIAELQARNLELETLLNTTRTAQKENASGLAQSEAKIQELASLNNDLSSQLNATRADLDRLSKTAEVNSKISARNKELSSLLDAKQAELDKLAITAASNTEIDSRNATLQQRNQQLTLEIAELKEDLSVAMDMFDEAANRDPDAELKSELEFALAEMEALTTEKLILKSELEQVSRALEDATATIELAATLQPPLDEFALFPEDEETNVEAREDSLPGLDSDELVELAASMDIRDDEGIESTNMDDTKINAELIDLIDANIIASARPVPSARITERGGRQSALELASSERSATPAISAATANSANDNAISLTVTKTAQPESIIMQPENVTTALQPKQAAPVPAAKQVLLNGEPAFIAQLGAFRSRSSAQSEIAMLQQAFPSDLAAAGLDIAPGRLSDGKDVYRITTNAMSAAEAADLCDVLWNQMVGCMLKAAR